jgi:hypothetical protein
MTDTLPELPQPGRAVRRGGIGDRLPRNATRRTARRGVGPVALPRAWITTDTPVSLVDDIARRLQLGVRPHETLKVWTTVDPHLARRHHPEYWVRLWGVDLASVADPVTIGPIFTLPSPRGSPTHGRRLLLLEAEVHWQDSPVYGLFKYRRGWSEVQESIKGIEASRNEYDVQMAARGLALARGHAPRGQPRHDREPELDRLADLARRWASAAPHRSIDDVQWRHLALADMRTQQALERAASKLDIRIGDIHQRARERDTERRGASPRGIQPSGESAGLPTR